LELLGLKKIILVSENEKMHLSKKKISLHDDLLKDGRFENEPYIRANNFALFPGGVDNSYIYSHFPFLKN